MIVIKCSQTPSIEGAIARAGSQAMFINRLQNGPCIKTVQEAGSLASEMAKTLPYLDVGNMVCCLGGGPVKRPCLLHSPDLSRPALSCDEIQRHNETLWQKLGLPPIIREQPRPASAVATPPSPNPNQDNLKKAILTHIHTNIFLGVKARFDVFKYNAKRIPMKMGEGLLEDMESAGFCVCIPIRLSLKGAATKFFALTDAGYETIGSPDNRLIPSGGSSIQHLFRLELLARKILKAQGIHAVIEAEKNGKKCDVSCQHKDLSIGIEVSVETPVDFEILQASRDATSGWDRVITVFDSRELCEKTAERFILEHGTAVSSNFTVCEYWHLVKFPIETIYNSPEVLFKPK